VGKVITLENQMDFISPMSSQMDKKVCNFLGVLFLPAGTWMSNSNEVE
jgi:hypothetical protein